MTAERLGARFRREVNELVEGIVGLFTKLVLGVIVAAVCAIPLVIIYAFVRFLKWSWSD